MPDSLGLTMAPWFGEAVAGAVVIIVFRALWRSVTAAIARRGVVRPLPAHRHDAAVVEAQATASRWS